MIGWSTIGYGAALSAVAAGVLVAVVARGHRVAAGLGAAVGAAAGPVAWNAILRATHADTFFTDAPVAVMPPVGRTPAPACSHRRHRGAARPGPA